MSDRIELIKNIINSNLSLDDKAETIDKMYNEYYIQPYYTQPPQNTSPHFKQPMYRNEFSNNICCDTKLDDFAKIYNEIRNEIYSRLRVPNIIMNSNENACVKIHDWFNFMKNNPILNINNKIHLNIIDGDMGDINEPYISGLNKIQIKNFKDEVLNNINKNVITIFNSFKNGFSLTVNEKEFYINKFVYVISTTGLYIQLDKFMYIKHTDYFNDLNIYKCENRVKMLDFTPGMIYINVLELDSVNLKIL